MGVSGPSKDPTVWDRLVENSDQYKEDSRMFRRTVFDEDDWCAANSPYIALDSSRE